MISREQLQQAADQRIIDPSQVDPLFRFLQASTLEDEDTGEEPLKFIRSFGDVFITLGVVLPAIAFHLLALTASLNWLAVAAFILLAEWLVRVRRLALPGIAILLVILFFINKSLGMDFSHTSATALLLICVTSLLFYLRYKMPFSLLPMAAGLVALVIMQAGLDMLRYPFLFILLGLLVFAAALTFDAMDTRRVSYLSDNAFWLHLLASPLIVHGSMFTLLSAQGSLLPVANSETIIIVFFILFFLLALLLDRRAMLISTQFYVIYAVVKLLDPRLYSEQNLMIYVLMGLGLFVLFFGSYWYRTRRLLFGFLQGSRLSQYLPDLNMEDRKR